MKTATRNSSRGAPTSGIVQALCGCIGDVIEGATNPKAEYPVVYVRLTVPCPAGHPARMGTGCIERFPPHGVRQITPEQLQEALAMPVQVVPTVGEAVQMVVSARRRNAAPKKPAKGRRS